jgi:hypothetical protein
MKRFKKKEVVKIEEVYIGFQCDYCKKKFNRDENDDDDDDYYSFNSHHSYWGDDSIESYDHYEVCSGKCFIGKVKEILKNENCRTLKIDDKERWFLEDLIKSFKL